MPTYGYRCTVCKHEFERFQKMTDPPVAECENCHAPVKKILYPVGIAFKGDGFYVNDYAPKSAKDATKADTAPAESKDAASAPAAPSTGSETKSDTTSTAPATSTPSASATPAATAPAPAKPASS